MYFYSNLPNDVLKTNFEFIIPMLILGDFLSDSCDSCRLFRGIWSIIISIIATSTKESYYPM